MLYVGSQSYVHIYYDTQDLKPNNPNSANFCLVFLSQIKELDVIEKFVHFSLAIILINPPQ